MKLFALLVLVTAFNSQTDVLAATKAHADPYEPTSEHPFGNRNPAAAPEISQFEFLIGEHWCTDTLTDLEGKTERVSSRWRGEYVLNGQAIQDHYWNGRFSATNIRVFDQAANNWVVSYFRLPEFRSGVWRGKAADTQIVLHQSFEQNGAAVESILTFSNISKEGFDWMSEYVSGDKSHISWTSSCRRANKSK